MKASFCLWKPTTVDSLPTSAISTTSRSRTISRSVARFRESWSPRMKRRMAMEHLRFRQLCGSERLEHHVAIHQPMQRVAKRARQGADNLKTQPLPKRHGARVGRHDMVELHGQKASCLRDLLGM